MPPLILAAVLAGGSAVLAVMALTVAALSFTGLAL